MMMMIKCISLQFGRRWELILTIIYLITFLKLIIKVDDHFLKLIQLQLQSMRISS